MKETTVRRPAFYMLARAQARIELRQRGYGILQAFEIVRNIDDGMIEAAVTEANAEAGLKAIGDGAILEKILAFFKSDLGQLLIKILMTLLLGPADSTTDITTAEAS